MGVRKWKQPFAIISLLLDLIEMKHGLLPETLMIFWIIRRRSEGQHDAKALSFPFEYSSRKMNFRTSITLVIVFHGGVHATPTSSARGLTEPWRITNGQKYFPPVDAGIYVWRDWIIGLYSPILIPLKERLGRCFAFIDDLEKRKRYSRSLKKL